MIIVGIRSDVAAKTADAVVSVSQKSRTVNDAIGMLPALRSGISRGLDYAAAWRTEVANAAGQLASIYQGDDGPLGEAFSTISKRMKDSSPTLRASSCLPEDYGASTDELLRWLERPDLRAIAQHETRGHMTSDLGRYLFASVFGSVHRYSPKAADFPVALTLITAIGIAASSMIGFEFSSQAKREQQSRAISPRMGTTSSTLSRCSAEA